jgi:glutamyl-tRNA synthetase
MSVRTRFAPSPTGFMHIGNLRTALYAYLIAKHEGGTFVLRIEDTDRARQMEESVDVIYDSLATAGLEYDEGPGKEGDHGPYIQSQRKHLYTMWINKLMESDHAYRCFCSPEEIAARREAAAAEDQDGQYMYDRKCRNLSDEESRSRAEAGESFVVRQKIPLEGSTTYSDHVYGEITIENKQLDDQVLLKSDGFPTYNFANVIDDHLMEITHVVRGQEYLSSTPKYNLLYQAFGWTPPEYVHLPHIVKEGGKKLSKREGDASFQDLLKRGFIPEAIVNYIALLGWNPGTDEEFFTLADLIERFDLDRINKSSAAFSDEKLAWLNSLHIREKSPEEFHEIAWPFYPHDARDLQNLEFISELLQGRVEKLSDIPELVAPFIHLSDYDIELYRHKKMKSTPESALDALQAALPILKEAEPWTNDELYGRLKALSQEKGVKNGTIMWPVRTALSGLPSSPGGATQLAVALGREETLKRIEDGMERLSQAVT